MGDARGDGAGRGGAGTRWARHPERSEGAITRAFHRPTVALFRGCVMDTLFRHVHDATRRTLEANGYTVVEPQGQACCGALHEHAGDRAAAEALARENVAALGRIGGLRRGEQRRLRRAAQGLRPPARHRGRGASSPPGCATSPSSSPRPGRARAAPCRSTWPTTRPATCSTRSACSGAARRARGHPRPPPPPPAQLGQVLRQRGHLLGRPAGDGPRGARPQAGELRRGGAGARRSWRREIPGCLMQIGAGVRAAGLPIRVVHPVELLDRELSGRRGVWRKAVRRSGGQAVS